MSQFFPSLNPLMTNKIWFNVENNCVVESDAELTKQELEFTLEMKEEVNKGHNVLPYGKTKEKNEEQGEEEEEEEIEDESNEEIDDDTDDIDTASNEVDSIMDDDMS